MITPFPDQIFGQINVLDRQIQAKLSLSNVKPEYVQELRSPEQGCDPLRIPLPNLCRLFGKLPFDREVADEGIVGNDHRLCRCEVKKP